MSGFYQGLDEGGLFTKTRKKELALLAADSVVPPERAVRIVSSMTDFQSSPAHTTGERTNQRRSRHAERRERPARVGAPLVRVVRELRKLAHELIQLVDG